jgi:hypothetical protein
MPWWGFLIFGVVLIGATALVTYLLVRRAVGAIDRNALAASEKARVEEELAAERKKKAELEAAAGELRARLEANRAWYEKTKEKIDEELDKEYADLSRDDDALLGKLAELLGGAEAPGGAEGEGPGDEEGRARGERGDPTQPGGAPEDPEGPRGAGEEGGGGG